MSSDNIGLVWISKAKPGSSAHYLHKYACLGIVHAAFSTSQFGERVDKSGFIQ